MSAIGPGDWVECICTDSTRAYGLQATYAGSLYCVAAAEETACTCDRLGCDETLGLLLVGDPPLSRGSHCGCGFRPIYRPDEKLIRDLLTDIPATPDLVLA